MEAILEASCRYINLKFAVTAKPSMVVHPHDPDYFRGHLRSYIAVGYNIPMQLWLFIRLGCKAGNLHEKHALSCLVAYCHIEY